MSRTEKNRADMDTYKRDVAVYYLSRIEALESHIMEKMEDIRRLDDMAVSVTSRLAPGRASGGQRMDFGDIAARQEEIKEEIEAFRMELEKVIADMDRVLDTVEDEGERRVLKLFYLYKLSVEDIAAKLDRSEKHIYRLRGRGLSHIELPLSVYEEYEREMAIKQIKSKTAGKVRNAVSRPEAEKEMEIHRIWQRYDAAVAMISADPDAVGGKSGMDRNKGLRKNSIKTACEQVAAS